jgi:hypothetical protein
MRVGVGAIAVALSMPAPLGAGELEPPLEVSSVAGRVLAAQPGDSFLFVVGDRISTARIDRTGISGRGLYLRFSGDRLRGRVGGQRVDLQLRGEQVSGRIGTREVSLDVGRSAGALKVIGRFGSRAVSEDLTPGAVDAEVGPCRYVLRFRRAEYQGQVGCGGQPEQVRLRVPAALVARGDVELAALFTALLSR